MSFKAKTLAVAGFINDAAGAPPVPEANTITARVWGSGAIRLDWTPSAFAENYTLYRNESVISSSINSFNYLDSGLTPGSYGYQVSGVNISGSDVSNFYTITATLTESENAIWTAFKNTMNANAGLIPYVSTYTYNRVQDVSVYPALQAYPYISDPTRHLELTIAVKAKEYGTDDSIENRLTSFTTAVRDAINTIPLLESWLYATISTNELVAMMNPKDNVAEAYMEVKVGING